MTQRTVAIPLFVVIFLSLLPRPGSGAERLCDTEFEDCRAQLLTLIRNETQGIDIAYWYMSDLRYSTEIIKRFKAGVPVRILMDVRVGDNKPNNGPTLAAFRDSGVPMRKKSSGGILHWKMMLFHGQNMVEFSKANYSGESFVPIQPGVDYTDEAVFFTDDDALTNTFRTKFDDMWINTTTFKNYANVSGPLVRHYPQFSRASSMNFPPGQDFGARAVSRYNAETERIDIISFRITDARHANALIAAVRRGVPVRVITEPQSYRDTKRPEHAMNVDRMYMAGVKIKSRTHQGLTHEAAIILYHLGEVIFGSSNLSPYSASYQNEHNFFYRPALGKPWFYQWFVDQFQRKWNSTSDYAAFQPRPPGGPAYLAPSNGAANVPYAATLVWDGGNWAGKYDLYFGTSSTPPLAARDLVVGSPDTGVRESYVVSNLKPGTRYYWRIVSKTMANKTASGPTWSFITAASSASGSAPNIVLYAGRATVKAGNWQIVNDASAAGGRRMHEPNQGAPKVGTASANPKNYFELSFKVRAGVPYHLWMRARADGNSYNNDSVWMQFRNSVNGSGTPAWRIGTTNGVFVALEECSGCGVQGWGWHDNGSGRGVRGAPIYFASTGTTTVRVQQREDGISIDQIVLSPSTYKSSSPGKLKNDTVILAEAGRVASDTTASGINEIVMHARDVSKVVGKWSRTADSTAANGIRLWNPNAGVPRPSSARATPTTYFEKTFRADAGKAYHLWLRMKAENNAWANDSVWVQFSTSRNAAGSAVWRIGTSSAAEVSLEEGNGNGEQGWGWNDNAYGSLAAPIYFAASGTQTIRVQSREDGVSIDQIVLSAVRNLTTPPGALKNDRTIVPATVGP